MIKSTRLIAVGAALSLALVGCGGNSSNTASSSSAPKTASASATAQKSGGPVESNQKATLDDWDGTWQSAWAYVDNDEIKTALQEEAKEKNKSEDEVKKDISEHVGTKDFDAVVVKDGAITFVKDLKDAKNPTEKAYKYTFEKAYDVKSEVHGEGETWYFFKGEDGAPYKYIGAMHPHDEEHLMHFHLRVGNSIDELLKKDHWYPVMFNNDNNQVKIEQIKDEILEHDH